jgi:arginyl-tRNA synthetase
MDVIRHAGAMVEKEGAVWFASSGLGEDKDNVLIRSTGAPTYFASDIAYHYDKFLGRGFDSVIDIWGADHQGHVSRVITAVESLGIEKERIEIIIGQLVALKRGGETVRFSKRAGEIITLREVIDEVGGDACRYCGTLPRRLEELFHVPLDDRQQVVEVVCHPTSQTSDCLKPGRFFEPSCPGRGTRGGLGAGDGDGRKGSDGRHGRRRRIGCHPRAPK